MCLSPQFRDDVYHNILTSDLPNLLEHGNITALTHLWSSGQISNFEYLTHLNKHAGRSFNDLMQYPVFPFILRDYTSETLDLQDSSIYRSAPRFPFLCRFFPNPSGQVRLRGSSGSGTGPPEPRCQARHVQPDLHSDLPLAGT